MKNALKSFRFVCSFVALASVLAVPQNNPAPTSQSNAVLGEPHSDSSLNYPGIPQGFSARGRSVGTPSIPALRLRRSQLSGLNFAPPVAYTSGGYIPFAVAVADVNEDNQPDILVANWCTSYSHDPHSSCVGDGLVGVLLNNGDGTFQAAVPYDSGGYFAVSIAVADLNADGEPDIIVANCTDFNNCSNTGSVDVLLGNGDGTFQKATPYSAGYQALGVTVADVNGDGKPDLLIADCSDASCVEDSSDSSVGVMLGNGDGSFQPIVYYASGGYFSRSVAVADVNGDENSI